jgi:glutathionylspermidine synthase
VSADAAYDALAARVVAGGIVTDPWLDGAPRLRAESIVVSPSLGRALHRTAERIAEVYDEACRVVSAAPELLDAFFTLSPYQKAMWLASEPMWHGIARADVFVTDEGLAITELNCDTPTGEAEAVVLNALAAEGRDDVVDPTATLEARFVSLVEALLARTLGPGAPRVAGLVYPTELTEDLALVRLYRRWLEAAGFEVVLGSPYNLALGEDGRAELFDVPISVMVRHYKTDWWGERVSVWTDEQIPDPQPLSQELATVLSAMMERKLAVVNPLGAVLPQNKRTMALMWEHLHRFSPASQETIRRHVPVTSRLEVLHPEQLVAEKDEWVLKSDYGAEGDEVVIGRLLGAEDWRRAIGLAREGRWIAQRYFAAEQAADGSTVNYGVYLVGGEAAGLYARVQLGPTDDRALSAPILVARGRAPSGS